MQIADQRVKSAGVVFALALEARTMGGHDGAHGEPFPLPGSHWGVIAGMGAEQARRATRRLLSQRVTHLMSWGLCGALEPGHDAGTIVIPDTLWVRGDETHAVDEVWRGVVESRLSGRVPLLRGRLAHSDQPLVSARDKAALRTSSGAGAVDMESAAIAAVAREAGVPFMVLRAVADTAGQDLPPAVVSAVAPGGGLRPWAVLKALLLAPGQIKGLCRLAGQTRRGVGQLRYAAGILRPDLGLGGD